MPLEDFLDVYCDRCGSNFQSNSYHGVIDIIREHLLSGLNICKVENMKISSRTENRDPTSDYNEIKYENNKLIHEHDLVPVNFNGVMA